MPTYKPNEIGVALTPEAFCSLFNETKGGLFASVRNYVNAKGEIATHCFQIGVDYGKVVKRSIAIVDAWLAQGCIAGVEQIKVHYRTWVDADGIESNRKAKGRVEVSKHLTLDASDPLVIQALRSILADLTKPADEKKQGADYEKNAKSVYSLERADGAEKVYLRDCLTVGKTVHVEGESDDAKTTGDKAIRDAVRRLLPVGKYRQYFIDKFDSLTLGGVSLMVDDVGNAYQTTPDLAKDVQLNPEAADVVRQNEPVAEPEPVTA